MKLYHSEHVFWGKKLRMAVSGQWFTSGKQSWNYPSGRALVVWPILYRLYLKTNSDLAKCPGLQNLLMISQITQPHNYF